MIEHPSSGCPCQVCQQRAQAQNWRARGAGDVVTFPCWIFTPDFGVARALHWANLNGLWTHWMPCINSDPPNPPGELEPTDPAILATIYSPARIQILLRCHVSPEPLPNFDAPVSQETIAEFLRLGVIEPHGPIQPGPQAYRTTMLGRAWVAALCNVPIPRTVYLDEQGREISFR